MGILFAIGSGLLMAVQGAMTAALGRAVGLYWMLLSVYLVGGAAALALVLGLSRRAPALGRADAVLWLAGPIGVGITLLVAAAVPRLGMVRTTTFIVVAQLLAAALLDALGLLGLRAQPFPAWRLFGVLALALGAYLLLRPVRGA